MQNFEAPYRTRMDNFLEMFSIMFIVMVLHASKQSDGSKPSYLTSSVRASFVLSLVVLMTILLVLIKVSADFQPWGTKPPLKC